MIMFVGSREALESRPLFGRPSLRPLNLPAPLGNSNDSRMVFANGIMITTQKNRFCHKKDAAKVETRNPPPVNACGHQGRRRSQWCNRPPMRERSLRDLPFRGPVLFVGTKRRRGVGRWWGFTPLFAKESESNCKKVGLQAPPPLGPSLSAPGVPIMAA